MFRFLENQRKNQQTEKYIYINEKFMDRNLLIVYKFDAPAMIYKVSASIGNKRKLQIRWDTARKNGGPGPKRGRP